MSVRGHLKIRFERSLLASGAARLARSRRIGDVLVLAYHNVVPEGEQPTGERSLHLPQRVFAEQLDLLCRTHDVVPLATLLREPGPGRRPRAVVTFDDAYRGAVTAGVRELAARGLPATLFVAPGLAGRSFWWDYLTGPGADHPPEVLRARALDELDGTAESVGRWAMEAGMGTSPVPAHATAAEEAELREAVKNPGITVASHTWSHAALPRLRGPELERELTRPLCWLGERFGSAVIPWLSYPYGLSSPGVERATAAAGYDGALRIAGGWIRGGRLDRYALPRLNVPAGLSVSGFAVRISGLLCR